MRRAVPVALVIALGAVMAVFSACGRGVPAIDPGPKPKPASAAGTISGTVRGPEGTSPITGRQVEVINVDTGERQSATTSASGGFAFKVKPGKYQVEVALSNGESVVKRPGVMHVNRSAVDAHADFVLSGPRTSRPRSPAVGREQGLRAPIA